MHTGKVGKCSRITTVNTLREAPTQGAWSCCLRRGDTEGEMASFGIHFRRLHAEKGARQKRLEELQD